MISAQSAHKASLAIVLIVAALVSPHSIRAASGNTQICQPSSSCTVGEFLYDDSYTPITGATCTITARQPDGTLLLNASAMTAAADGWYSKDVSTPSTEGLYRAQVCCTSGSDYLCLDKTFEVQESTSLSSSDVSNAVWGASRASYNSSGTFGQAVQNIVPAAGDVASSVWDYSGRTLTSFGTVVSDVWSVSTRTLTGAGLSSGNLATQSDVTSNAASIVSNVSNITNNTTNIDNAIEKIINNPTIDQQLETTLSTEQLESKIEETRKISAQINTKTQYMKSKVALATNKWSTYQTDDLAKTIADADRVLGVSTDIANGSVYSSINWLQSEWGWKESLTVLSQTKSLKQNLASISTSLSKNGKTNNTKSQIGSLLSSIDKLQTANQTLILKKIQEVEGLVTSLNNQDTYLNNMLITWDNSKLDTTKNELNKVSNEIASLNQIPKASPIILTQVSNKSTEKEVRNKVLGLKGIITANKLYLSQQPGNSLSSTWLELGSIVFKTLITNPSTKVSQTVPLKYYLPKEIKKENIIEIDDAVTVQYDTEKDQYYIKGDFVLSPGTTKTVSVRVDDSIFAVSDDEISSLRQQAIDLSEPLKNTSYFAQGATLKSDIDAALSKVVSLQKSATTPEEKIRAYREAKIEMDEAVAKLDKLKEVTTTAGSVGTLFGFVGGTQALAVWGLIIIMAAGFVFLVIYMRVLRFNGSAVSPAITEHEVISPASKKSKKTASQTDDVVLGIPVHHTSNRIKHLKFAAIVVSVGIIASAATAAFSNRSVADTKPAPKTAAAAVTATSDQVLGASETAPAAEKIKIFVPKDSVLNVLNQPSLDATVAAVLDVSQDGYQLDSKDEWVKIKTTVEQKEVTGWISLDFVEKELPAVETKIPSVAAPVAATAKSPEFVTINDTSVGFLRVRQSPWGKEITRVIPGEKFKFVSEEKGWISIHLEDGTLGWVAKQYVTVTN